MPASGRATLTDGWAAFYNSAADDGRPHLRTYEHAEKFAETFPLQSAAPPRPGKAAGPPLRESYTWGMGGTEPQGRRRLQPFPAADFKVSQKKFIPPHESSEMASGLDLGRKKHVFDDAGNDRAHKKSAGFLLEDMLQRKQRVPEEARTDARTIHRWAPRASRAPSPHRREALPSAPARPKPSPLRPPALADARADARATRVHLRSRAQGLHGRRVLERLFRLRAV